jgi:hypothetical protein
MQPRLRILKIKVDIIRVASVATSRIGYLRFLGVSGHTETVACLPATVFSERNRDSKFASTKKNLLGCDQKNKSISFLLQFSRTKFCENL